MRGYLFICILIFFTNSCNIQTEEFYFPGFDFPERPINGYNRHKLFPLYSFALEGFENPMCNMLSKRRVWLREFDDFRSYYPEFKVELLTFNQILSPDTFSWQERIIFSDAFDLLVFAINSPIFEEFMSRRNFYDNDRTNKIPTDQIIKIIRTSSLKMIIGKTDLDEGVLAEATVGGIVNHIWFREDTNYATYNVVYLAMILGHELMHNIGFKHESNVPYGVHNPIIAAIYMSKPREVNQFKQLTPYYEEEFLRKVRVFYVNSYKKMVDNIQKDFTFD